ncbi:MAG: HU family DNA-binding protein [Candidatus Eremiobacteraeota bacterium]|nr:HU family DNA-binding protein [Candidatus Eremiobacteraeota bacterium]
MAVKTKKKVLGKRDLVEEIAKKADISKKDANLALNVILESIGEQLAKGNTVRLIPFGSFEVRHRKSRMGRNPRTGDEIKISARNVPAFKPGKALREAVK